MKMRRILGMAGALMTLLACLLLPSWTWAVAEDLQSLVKGLSDAELLELKAAVDSEAASRGLAGQITRSASAEQTDQAVMVWVPKSGKRYHAESTCSNMKNPTLVDIDTAKAMGFTPCKVCKPPK